ncbi:MAG: tRNA-dihydrouridine synthase, partial [Pseudomonadota bacterium]
VHGRTRCQFYKGHADWAAIADTVNAVDVPVIANGDILCAQDALAAKTAAGAYGVMIGRAAMGQPWLIAEIAARLTGKSFVRPSLAQQLDALCEQIEDSVALYEGHLGLRIVRKHIAAHVDKVDLPLSEYERRHIRASLCRMNEVSALLAELEELYSNSGVRVAA